VRNELGAAEAKTKLPQLLRLVQSGRRFTITNRGKPVAELGPPAPQPKPDARAAMEAFQAFRIANPVGQKVNIKLLIEAGRE
jgi:prevent-host-death family protein